MQMSIQPLGTAPAQTGSRGSVSPQTAPTGSSFQELLTHSAAKTGSAQTETAAARTPTRDELISTLFSLKVDHMRLGKEKEEEQDAWDDLMEYLDAWIKSLQDGTADIEEAARACAAAKARASGRSAGKKNPGDYLLEQITEHFGV